MIIYICVEHDESPTKESVHYTFTDVDEYLADFNECLNTNYSTIEEFNKGEDIRTIYKSEFNN